MNNKLLIGILILVLAGGALYMAYTNKERAQDGSSQRIMAPTWTFTEQPEKAGVPQTRVTMAMGEQTYDIGTFDGSCSVVEAKDENQIAAVLCWWAGGGKEIGVYEEGNKIVIKVGDVDEGDAETSGFRGNFKTIITL